MSFDYSEKPFVSVVMPVRNEGKFLNQSLGAVLGQDYPSQRIEILVSDGMSTDETREIIKKYEKDFLNVRLLDNQKKIVAPGLNEAIRQAKGGIIIRVDGHCIVSSDYVSQCVRLLQERKADAVGGVIQTVGETFIAKAIAVAMSSSFGVGNSFFRIGSNREMEVDTVPFPAYQKEIFEKIGYFDEELVRNQDDEFNARLRKNGGKIILSPSIQSQYYSRSSLQSLWNQYYQYGYWKVRVMQKNVHQMKLRHFIPPVFAGALLCGSAVAAFFPNFRTFFFLMLFIYLVVNLSASFLISLRQGIKYAFILPLIYFILHFSYGLGFLKGLILFSHEKK